MLKHHIEYRHVESSVKVTLPAVRSISFLWLHDHTSKIGDRPLEVVVTYSMKEIQQTYPGRADRMSLTRLPSYDESS